MFLFLLPVVVAVDGVPERRTFALYQVEPGGSDMPSRRATAVVQAEAKERAPAPLSAFVAREPGMPGEPGVVRTRHRGPAGDSPTEPEDQKAPEQSGRKQRYVHDPDVPEECYNQSRLCRKLRIGCNPKCHDLRAIKEEKPVRERIDRPERDPRAPRDGRASLWILGGASTFMGIIGCALAVPFFMKQEAIGLEYYPEHVQDVAQAYATGDSGYLQRLAQEQNPQTTYEQQMRGVPEGYNLPFAAPEGYQRVAAPPGAGMLQHPYDPGYGQPPPLPGPYPA